MAANVSAMRAITGRGMTRCDLPAGTPVTLALDTLFGGLLMHCLTTPPSKMARLAESADTYTAALVELVLSAVGTTAR
jgi:hypothetical protein